MSIAYQESYPILDANVKRVISRYKKIDLNGKDCTKQLWLTSEELTPEVNIFEYTQGIMDLGATVCTSKSQDCMRCPVNKNCKSAYEDINARPKVKKERSKKKIYFTLAHSNDSFLLFKKNEKSFWESLWVPYDTNGLKGNDIFKEPANKKIKNINHLLSHMELDITVEIVDYKTPFKVKTNLEHEWISKDQIHNYGLPKPIMTIIENHG